MTRMRKALKWFSDNGIKTNAHGVLAGQAILAAKAGANYYRPYSRIDDSAWMACVIDQYLILQLQDLKQNSRSIYPVLAHCKCAEVVPRMYLPSNLPWIIETSSYDLDGKVPRRRKKVKEQMEPVK